MPSLKQSYTIPCSSAFRDAVMALADKRGVNVGDLARSVMLVVPNAVIDAYPDPGEPESHDRETVILKSGPAQGRPWRRKPRLQLRLSPGHSVVSIRRALGLAVDMDGGDVAVRVARSDELDAQERLARDAADAMRIAAEAPAELARAQEELRRLRDIVDALAFKPLDHGVMSRDDALHVLGFAPGSRPNLRSVRAQYRLLASIHHPDSHFGDHARMTQINAAMELLRQAAA